MNCHVKYVFQYLLAASHLFDASSRSQCPVGSAYDISPDPLVTLNCAVIFELLSF